VSDNLPEEKTLRTTSFVIHATRGVIREQTMRRKMMLGLLVIALALLVCGSTFLQSFLSPREHPGWFILFWVACGWVAVTAMLLAILDIVLVKREQRAGERDLRQGVSAQDETGS
jgi:hypothetical protein